MPVMLLTPDEVDRWLSGGSVEEARAMQKPAPNDAIIAPVVVAIVVTLLPIDPY